MSVRLEDGPWERTTGAGGKDQPQLYHGHARVPLTRPAPVSGHVLSPGPALGSGAAAVSRVHVSRFPVVCGLARAARGQANERAGPLRAKQSRRREMGACSMLFFTQGQGAPDGNGTES